MFKLLIIDEDTFFINSARYFFGSEGFHIDTTNDGKEALSLADQNKYDLVICSTQLQHKSGFEVSNAIKVKNPSTQIVLISPANNILSMKVTDDLDYDAYFQKPINFNIMKETIDRLLSPEKV